MRFASKGAQRNRPIVPDAILYFAVMAVWKTNPRTQVVRFHSSLFRAHNGSP